MLVLAVREIEGLTPIQKCALMVLASHMGGNTEAWPSLSYWARKVGCTKYGLQKVRNQLIELGYIYFVDHGSPNRSAAYGIKLSTEVANPVGLLENEVANPVGLGGQPRWPQVANPVGPKVNRNKKEIKKGLLPFQEEQKESRIKNEQTKRREWLLAIGDNEEKNLTTEEKYDRLNFIEAEKRANQPISKPQEKKNARDKKRTTRSARKNHRA